MKYATVDGVIASFPHPVIPTVQGEPDYQTIHATRKFLQANSTVIDTHLGQGNQGNLGRIASDASYTMITPATDACPILWISPQAPGRDQPTWTAHPPRLGQPTTFGRRTSKLTAHTHPCNMIWKKNHQCF
jgi:hypothetical protein